MKRLLALLLPLWLLTGAAAAYDGQDAVFARFPLSELAQYAGTSESDWLASALAERGAEGADVYADALTANLASGTARILFPTDGMRIAMTYKSLGSPSLCLISAIRSFTAPNLANAASVILRGR